MPTAGVCNQWLGARHRLFSHHGAKPLSAIGEKMGHFWWILSLQGAQIGGREPQGSWDSIMESAWLHAKDICLPQVCGISDYALFLDFCPPQVYEISG